MPNVPQFKMPSHSQHSFAMVPQVEVPRSVFNQRATYKTMFSSGYLIPFYWEEIYPGDTFNVNATLGVRMPSALNVPVMDNMYLDTFYFFSPTRILWTNFLKMMGEQANPGDSTSYTVPNFTAYNCTAESLSDYLGVPPLAGGATKAHNSLLWRMYNLTVNQWFRDQNLQNSLTVDLGDGPDSIANYTLQKRGKRHDYFTSCLPWTQKGTAVSAPIGGTAPVTGIGKENQLATYTSKAVYETNGTNPTYAYAEGFDNGGAYRLVAKMSAASGAYPRIYADLSSATGLDINALRLAFQTQRMLERDARGGTRYTEMVKSHFGVTSPDARLQRVEFLGGKSTPINVTPVAQTSATSGQPTPSGDLSATAHGISVREGFTKSFTEHGYVMAICNVRSELSYQQGLDRKLSRSTRLDFYWPALSSIGEQAVLNQEIYLQGSAGASADATAFGYQERYAECRYKPSLITGKLRSTYATPLDMWHLSEKFTSAPALNSTFIVAPTGSSDPIQRIIAVTSEPQFVLDVYLDIKAVRPMPVYGVPGYIDHF